MMSTAPFERVYEVTWGQVMWISSTDCCRFCKESHRWYYLIPVPPVSAVWERWDFWETLLSVTSMRWRGWALLLGRAACLKAGFVLVRNTWNQPLQVLCRSECRWAVCVGLRTPVTRLMFLPAELHLLPLTDGSGNWLVANITNLTACLMYVASSCFEVCQIRCS